MKLAPSLGIRRIELSPALRKPGKDCVFLQYWREPHRLQKYPNKLDDTIKMREYLNHYLNGLSVADWILEGVPYRGE